jgi:hypothetical protein
VSPDAPRFTVEGAGRFPTQLDRLIVIAQQRGLRTLLIEVLRQTLENLETRPRDWGDPYINYRGLNAVGYGRTILPAQLRVEYAVHNTEPLVWLSALIPLPGSPFAGS